MKNIIIALFILVAGYQGWNALSKKSVPKPQPLYSEAYVVVYGRKTCGFTQQTIKDLKRKKIPFEFKSVDNRAVADVLHSRMRGSGIDTRHYNLPVVDVSNTITVRPNTNFISDTYNN